jgi:hypothetical protein
MEVCKKYDFFPLHAIKALGESGSIAPFILNLGAFYRLVFNIASRKVYPQEINPITVE